MSLEQLNTLDDVRHFLDGTQAVAFGVATNKQERYRWVQMTLVKQRYILLGKPEKGLVTRYLMKVTSYSLAQTKRLIRQYIKTGKVTVKQARGNGFKPVYTDADVRLLARMDELHGQPSGAVLKKLCERAHSNFQRHCLYKTRHYLRIAFVQFKGVKSLSTPALHAHQNRA